MSIISNTEIIHQIEVEMIDEYWNVENTCHIQLHTENILNCLFKGTEEVYNYLKEHPEIIKVTLYRIMAGKKVVKKVYKLD